MWDVPILKSKAISAIFLFLPPFLPVLLCFSVLTPRLIRQRKAHVVWYQTALDLNSTPTTFQLGNLVK